MAASRRAAARGADAVLVRTPAFFKAQMTSDVFVAHYTAVADASPVPVLLYNVTMFTGVNLPPDAVERLAAHPNIAGLKESGGDMTQIAEYIARSGDGFVVLAGSATTFFHAICAGCAGGVLAVAALVPELCAAIAVAVRAGRVDEARMLQRRMTPLARSVGSTYGVAGLKAALDLMGLAGGDPRPPLQPAAPVIVDVIRRQLAECGVTRAGAAGHAG
jgi:4-hydroxy-2-oxoglutarate aldolase